MRYALAIHKDKDSDYGVSVPDLPGCFSAGNTLDDAIDQAKEAIETHIEGLLLDNDPVPEPSDIESLRAQKEFKNAIWSVADVDISKLSGKTLRINITVGEHLLNQVDEAVARKGGSRSGFLAEAAMEHIRKAKEEDPIIWEQF